MCVPALIAPLAGIGGAMTGTAAAAGTAMAASNAALAIKGISAVGGVVSSLGQASAQNARYEQNAASALDAYYLKTTLANKRIMEESTQASQQKDDANIKAMKAQSTASAAAAGSGVQGVDVGRLLDDFERSEGILNSRIDQKLDSINQQNEMEKLQFQSEAVNRINSVQPANFAETLFNAVEPVVGFGLDYYDTKARYADLEN